jgi:hypothetical protein
MATDAKEQALGLDTQTEESHPMSDLNNPNDPSNFDKYGNPAPGSASGPGGPAYVPVESTGRAPYVLLGLLVLVGIVGGALYFNGNHNARRGADVANAPPAVSDTVRTPGSPALPQTGPQTGPTGMTPAPTITPAPGGAPTDTMKQ